MNITVIALGKLKEKYLKDAISEYSKRIGAYGKLDIIELTPVRLSDSPSQTEIDNALSKEAEEIKKKIPNGSYVFSLCKLHTSTAGRKTGCYKFIFCI